MYAAISHGRTCGDQDSIPVFRDPQTGRGYRRLYFYQVHLYHWLETNGYGRFLADNDF
jgi:hypothetical protein